VLPEIINVAETLCTNAGDTVSELADLLTINQG
jgi:hypothetical protein